MSALTDEQRVVIGVVRCLHALGTCSEGKLAEAICAAYGHPPKGKFRKTAVWMIGFCARSGYVSGTRSGLGLTGKARAEITDRVDEHERQLAEGAKSALVDLGYGAELAARPGAEGEA